MHEGKTIKNTYMYIPRDHTLSVYYVTEKSSNNSKSIA